MEKLKCSFPTSRKQSYPQFHKTASYTHSHNADDYEISHILKKYFVRLTLHKKVIYYVADATVFQGQDV